MDEVREFARSYTDAWCSGNPASVAEHYTEDGSLTVNGGMPAVGRAEIADVAESFMSAFPGMQVSMDEVRPGERGIEYHWTLAGTNGGPGGTGKSVRISGYEEWRLADGLIAESQGHFDEAEYERQLRDGV